MSISIPFVDIPACSITAYALISYPIRSHDIYMIHIYIYKYPIIPLCPSISHYVIIFLAVPPLYLHSAWRAWGAHQFPLIESIHRDKLQEELTNLNCSACWDTCGNFSPSFQWRHDVRSWSSLSIFIIKINKKLVLYPWTPIDDILETWCPIISQFLGFPHPSPCNAWFYRTNCQQSGKANAINHPQVIASAILG